MFFFSSIEMPFTGKEKTFKLYILNFEWFLHMVLKFEIISIRISQVIRLQNYINFSETLCVHMK